MLLQVEPQRTGATKEVGTTQNLSINDFRHRVHTNGLCVDGSREALIAVIEAKSVVGI
jgi:hypothetical protein